MHSWTGFYLGAGVNRRPTVGHGVRLPPSFSADCVTNIGKDLRHFERTILVPALTRAKPRCAISTPTRVVTTYLEHYL
jgi:hypothetical protein